MRIINRIKSWIDCQDWYVLTDILTVVGPAAFFILIAMLTSCSTLKEIPVQTIERVEYRDSLIYVNDTITVEVPKEKVIYVGPADTTSQIATSLAFSEAKIDKGILTHTLEQKGQIKAKIDTVFKVEYIDRIIEKEVPVEVVKEVKHIPSWCWWNLIYSIAITLIICFRLYLKYGKVL